MSVDVEPEGEGPNRFVFGISTHNGAHAMSNVITWSGPHSSNTYTFEGLEPNTQYFAWAYAMGDNEFDDSSIVRVHEVWSKQATHTNKAFE